MSGHSLERVQQDLDIIRSALPSDSPYDRRGLIINAVAGLCGIPFALRALPGWERPATVVLFAALGGLGIFYTSWIRRAQSERGGRPRRWSVAREEIISAAIVAAALIVYAVLKRWLAPGEGGWNFKIWRGEFASPALFGCGVYFVSCGMLRHDRRGFLGWGLAILGLGLAMPWIESRAAFWAIGGLAVTLGGIVSTAVIWWQLKEWERAHVDH